MRALSLRARLSILAALMCGLILGAFGVGVSWHLSHEVLESVRKNLQHEAAAFFQTVRDHRASIDWQDIRTIRKELQAEPMFHPFEVSEVSGKTLFRSLGMGRMSLAGVPLTPGYHSWKDEQGRKYLIGTFIQDGLMLRIVGDMDDVNEIAFDLVTSFLSAGPVMLVMGALGSWLLLRRAFRPVDQIVAAAGRITAQNLDERLPAPATEDEIGRLTLVLNQMIDRLETSFQQASRFTADASHELKTPLTILRNDLEMRIREKHASPAAQQLLTGFLEQITELCSITDKLLLLSRADAGQLPLRAENFDLCEMLGGLVEDVEILGSSNGIGVSTSLASGPMILGDQELLNRLFLNLLDNAVKYNRYGGTVEIRLVYNEGYAETTISNTGGGISAEHAQLIFNRFHRGAHRGVVRGHGLGLSLCREIALAHGGRIELLQSHPERTEFRVSLPISSNIPQAMPAISH